MEGTVPAVVEPGQYDRPAECYTTLELADYGAVLLEERSRVKYIVIDVAKNRSMYLVGAGTDRNICKPTSCSSIFRVERVSYNAEFTHMLHGWTILLNCAACISLAGRSAVEETSVLPGLDPFTRGDHVEAIVTPGRNCKKEVMSLLRPTVIKGES